MLQNVLLVKRTQLMVTDIEKRVASMEQEQGRERGREQAN